mmetsp:Transcript_5717/g.7026  ORF Transcript_5717/g.7026 Transcript_5717/m.7026 type:complete len:222 (-) Transcript_5717:775-1440(-)
MHVPLMPIHILHHIRMPPKDTGRVQRQLLPLQFGIQIPVAHQAILTPTNQLHGLMRIPAQSVPLPLVPTQRELWRERGFGGGVAGVFAEIKDVDEGGGALGGHHEMILWHVSSSIDFTLVQDLHSDINLAVEICCQGRVLFLTVLIVAVAVIGGLLRCGGLVPESTHLALLFIVRRGRNHSNAVAILVFRLPQINHPVRFGEIDGPHHEIILITLRGVRPQ